MSNKNNRTRNAKLNMASSLALQVIVAANGLILPRIIIPTYGSTMNGLIVSITQFISYITLLEAGVGSVFRSSLYAPLLHNDMQKISGIINEQRRFYRKIGIAFVIYIALLCAFFPLFPLIAKTGLDTGFVIALILILSVGTFIEYFVSLPYQSLIISDQMIRIINILSSAVIVFSLISTVILVRLGASILLVKLAACAIATLKPIIYVWYTKTHYKLDYKAEPDRQALSQRWNGMVHHFAFYVHRNTDVVILTLFAGTPQVSVYSIYLAVASGIERLVTSISSGSGAGIGNLLAEGDKEKIDSTVDIFEFIQNAVTTLMYTITGLMLMPFIRLYTSNMNDANYIEPVFGYLLLIAEAVYCVRCVYSTIAMSGNKYKETQIGAILEGTVNLLLSLLLIQVFANDSEKLIALAIGTTCGMFVRLICELWYLKKDLIFRPLRKAVKNILINILVAALGIITCSQIIDYNCNDAVDWVIKAIITTVVVLTEAGVVYFVFDRKLMISSLKKVLRK